MDRAINALIGVIDSGETVTRALATGAKAAPGAAAPYGTGLDLNGRTRVRRAIHVPDKVLCVFERHIEAIRKGKMAKPSEFGNSVTIQESERQIITAYDVHEHRPRRCHLVDRYT